MNENEYTAYHICEKWLRQCLKEIGSIEERNEEISFSGSL